MVQQQTGTSEAEEMYLITIARAIEDGRSEPIAVSLVARILDVTGVSANQMIRKLDSRGYLVYEPYRGVSLTEHGRAVASAVLRRRRLWGVFLTDRLGLSPARADEVACDLEHVTPPDVVAQLSGFLGNPSSGPAGRTIPAANAEPVPIETVPLSTLAAGTRASVVAVDLPEPQGGFIAEQGLVPGTPIEVLGVGIHGDRLLVVNGECIHLGADLVDGIVMEIR